MKRHELIREWGNGHHFTWERLPHLNERETEIDHYRGGKNTIAIGCVP